jgi:hypothetical protein
MNDVPASAASGRPAGALTAVARGASDAARHLPLAGVMWLVNLLVAIPLAAMFGSLVRTPLARAGSSDPQQTTYMFISDLMRSDGGALGALGEAAGWAGIVYMAASSLVAAGAIETLAVTPRGFRFGTFFNGIARYGGRFFRLFLLVLCATFVVLLLMNGPAAALVERVARGSDAEWPALGLNLVRYGATFVLLGAVVLVADYTRVRMILDDSPSALAEAGRSVGFVLARPAAIGAFALCELLSLAVLAVAAVLNRADRPATAPGVAALLVAYQAVMLARMWVRLTFWSAELEIVRGDTR